MISNVFHDLFEIAWIVSHTKVNHRIKWTSQKLIFFATFNVMERDLMALAKESILFQNLITRIRSLLRSGNLGWILLWSRRCSALIDNLFVFLVVHQLLLRFLALLQIMLFDLFFRNRSMITRLQQQLLNLVFGGFTYKMQPRGVVDLPPDAFCDWVEAGELHYWWCSFVRKMGSRVEIARLVVVMDWIVQVAGDGGARLLEWLVGLVEDQIVLVNWLGRYLIWLTGFGVDNIWRCPYPIFKTLLHFCLFYSWLK